MIRILLALIFSIYFSYGQLVGHTDSLLCNTKNGNTDRLLFYDKDCFIWIRQETLQKERMIQLSFGQFKVVGDTIYFTFPDSTRSANKYFCYCKYKGHDFTGFQLYNVPETWPPGSINRAFNDLFKRKVPNLPEVTTLVKFKAIRQNNKVIFLNCEGGTYLNNEYSYCN